MPLEKLECPNCGRKSQLSEYQENRYRCMRCDAIFKYWPPGTPGTGERLEQVGEEELFEPGPAYEELCPRCGSGMIVQARRSRVSLYAALVFLGLAGAAIAGVFETGGTGGIVISAASTILFACLFLGMIVYFFCLSPIGHYYRCLKCRLLVQKY